MNLRPDQADRPDTQVRAAAAGDLKFIDHLQSRFSHQVGYLPLVALEKKIKQGQVWVSLERGQPAGYVLGASGYKRRDDVAIIYQSAIDYSAQRRLLGTLLVECWAASLPSAVNQNLPLVCPGHRCEPVLAIAGIPGHRLACRLNF